LTTPSCGNCVFAIREPASTFCRRYPPSVLPAEAGQFRTSYPGVRDEFWCGEWKRSLKFGTPIADPPPSTREQDANFIKQWGNREVFELPVPDGFPKGTRTRAHVGFTNMGIKTVNELIEETEVDLLRQPNLGRKSVNYIKQSLAMAGGRLAASRER
jgi:hypothetical protein